MAEVRRSIGRLQIDTDHVFHRRVLHVQRIGWGFMAATIVAALLGLFGSGPLSRATIEGEGSPTRLDYERFARFGAPTTLRARLAVGPGPDDAARLRISHDYLRGIQIERITPEPTRTEARSDGVEFAFTAEPTVPHVEVTVHLKPDRVGPLRGRVDLGDGRMRELNQFVYP